VAKITIFAKNKLVAAAILDLFKVPVVLVVSSLLMMLESFKKCLTLIRERRTLGEPFDLAQTYAN